MKSAVGVASLAAPAAQPKGQRWSDDEEIRCRHHRAGVERVGTALAEEAVVAAVA